MKRDIDGKVVVVPKVEEDEEEEETVHLEENEEEEEEETEGFSKSQQRALRLVKEGHNVFITGSAGTGKSFLIKEIINTMEDIGLVTVLTASTGIAAWNIGGITLHSFAGIGLGQMKLKVAMGMLNKPQKKEKLEDWKSVRVLIIDEVSMIQVKFLKKLNAIAKLVRKSPLPFGGIQVIMVGDYFQCPSVEKDFVAVDPETGKVRPRYPFQAPLWEELAIKSVCLRENFRQADDLTYFQLLERIKTAETTKEDEEVLKGRLITKHPTVKDTDLIKLCSRRDEAEAVNQKALNNIKSPAHTFKGIKVNNFPDEKINDRYPVDEEIVLKVGAEVLLCYNMDTQMGLVNGSRGTVVDFRKDDNHSEAVAYPFVQFDNGFRTLIKPHKWECVKKKRVTSSFTQVPLILRYAVTIHKAQGLTLSKVLVSMNFFEAGQGYVAFSRVRKIEDLYLHNVNMSTLKSSQPVIDFYRKEGML